MSKAEVKIVAERPTNIRTLERYLLLANDLPGHPLDAAFERGLLEPGSTRLVYGYTAGKSFHPATAAPGPPDPELELRLRSLGYLQ